jgi:hypothetical protein
MNRRAADAVRFRPPPPQVKPKMDRENHYIPRVIENGDSKLRTLVRADVLVQELDLEALLLRLELDDVSDRNDAHHAAPVVDDR